LELPENERKSNQRNPSGLVAGYNWLLAAVAE
jgi:hypothetical protein